MKPAPILLLALSLALAGCETATYDPHVAAVDNQLLARSIQTRELSAERYQDVVTAVIGTLQDYHFRIVEVDPDLGTLTAYQMTDARSGRPLTGRTSLTVLIREREPGLFRVRMNMTVGIDVEDTPELYQQFFAALQRRIHARASA